MPGIIGIFFWNKKNPEDIPTGVSQYTIYNKDRYPLVRMLDQGNMFKDLIDSRLDFHNR